MPHYVLYSKKKYFDTNFKKNFYLKIIYILRKFKVSIYFYALESNLTKLLCISCLCTNTLTII